MARAIGAAVAATAVLVGGLIWMSSTGNPQETRALASAAGLMAFDQIASVMESPRCMNCHPRGERPYQGDDRHVHLMNVQRGPANKGLPAMACANCHQTRNNDATRIPGAPHWKMAPKSMGWRGLGRGELCRTLLDRSKNGGRTPATLVKHMTQDELVLWAWNPGAGRTPPPVTRDELKRALEAWVSAGTPCPQ